MEEVGENMRRGRYCDLPTGHSDCQNLHNLFELHKRLCFHSSQRRINKDIFFAEQMHRFPQKSNTLQDFGVIYRQVADMADNITTMELVNPGTAMYYKNHDGTVKMENRNLNRSMSL